MRRVPPEQPYNSRRRRDRRALRRQYLWVACGLLLVGGFIMATRQQVTAVQYGYRSEELRRERMELLEEQQRLLLAMEETSSPARLERAAQQIGLQPTRPAQISAARRGESGVSREGSRPAANPAPAGSPTSKADRGR